MTILYEDNHLIIVNKAPSELVQGDKTGDTPLSEILKKYLKEKYKKEGNVFLGVTHRLDRPVSGVVLFAKTSKALSRINAMFRNKEIKKKYWAIVNKTSIKEKELIHYLRKNERQNKSYASLEEVKNSKKAILSFNRLLVSDRYSLLEVDLKTGRHHQIRAQLSAIDLPIKGDLKYGSPRSNKNKGISLHARSIEFIHPVSKKRIYIEADPPKDNLWDYFLKELSR